MTSSTPSDEYRYDIFLSYASQDSQSYVNDLHNELQEEYRVWYDRTRIKWMDNLENAIREGLRDSYFGIVVLSPNYLSRPWPRDELDALLNYIDRIFLILHNIGREDIERYYPDKYSVISVIQDRHVISSREGLRVPRKIKEIVEGSIVGQRSEFAKLRKLLFDREWYYADIETFNLVNQRGGILGIPHEDFRMLDILWLMYGERRYGFSLQNIIYQDCLRSSRRNHLESYHRFCDLVGWSAILNFSPNPDTPRGRFPALAYFIHDLRGQAPLTRAEVENVVVQIISRDRGALIVNIYFVGFPISLIVSIALLSYLGPYAPALAFLYLIFGGLVCFVIVRRRNISERRRQALQQAGVLQDFFQSPRF